MTNAPDRPLIYDLDYPELEALLESWQQPTYRARQIWEWLYKRYAATFDEMTNVPLPLRSRLSQETTLQVLTPVVVQKSNDGQTEKTLFALHDGQLVETVLMRYEKRRTICISTQVGCAMGCVFCATGQMGFFRQLRIAEIVAQVTTFCRQLSASGEHLTNIVMMGMGEPLHNYANTIGALDRITDETGINLGARKITISTVGLVPAIRRYADEQRQTPLAVSLHAATDEERGKLLPVNRRWSLDELLDACRYYVNKTGRRITFEWALIADENDTPEQAHALGALLRGLLCHVNLIPLNPTGGYGGAPSSREAVERFQTLLQSYGVSSTVRVRRGIDIQAGCGQLRDRIIPVAERAQGVKIDFDTPSTNTDLTSA